MTRSIGPPWKRISGIALRPIGVRRVTTCRHAKSRTGKSIAHPARLQRRRDLTAVATGEDRRVRLGDLEGDVGPGVAGADDQDRAVPELARPAVLAGVQLQDRRVELVRDRWDVRRAAERAGRDHHVVAAVAAGVGGDDVLLTLALDALHPGLQPDGQLEVTGVRLEVVADLVLAREAPLLRGERQAGQAVVLGGRVELERVPLLAPVVADPGARVEDHERAAVTLQVVTGRQARLAGADDDGLDLCGVHDRDARSGTRVSRVGRTAHLVCATGGWYYPPAADVSP